MSGKFRLAKVCILASFTGMLAGFAAEGLHRLIGLVTNLAFYQHFSTHIVSPLDSPLGIFIIFVPATGGLIIGLMAKYGTSLVRGHGIPEAMEAVLLRRSRIHPKVAVLKPISAAVSIGSGQPFGAEGPIIQTGAAIGSILGQLTHTTAAERKVLLACGSAAGLAATFGTPIAAVIFAIELLLFEFRARSFIPLVIASTIATQVHIQMVGSEPVFSVVETSFGEPINLIFFLLLGVLCGGIATALTKLLYWIEEGYHRLPVSTYLWPAIGGLFVGIVGYAVPHFVYQGVDVFGPGYEMIGSVLTGDHVFGFLLVLLLAKSSVWLVSLGSGTSGGVLAPVFMIGAAAGAIFGLVLQDLFPTLEISISAFALAGMAAVFGSATRATFASIVFGFEMTQNYGSILPVMFTAVIADAIVNRLMHTSILTEQLRRGGVLVDHEYETDVLKMVNVASVMTTEPVIIPDSMTIGELAEKINQHDPYLSSRQGLLITDDKNDLRGIITQNDLRKAVLEGQSVLSVLEAGTKNPVVTYPDMSVREAMTLMLQYGISRLPVVLPDNPLKIVGYISHKNVMSSYLKRFIEEEEIETGWVQFDRLLTVGK